jgi:hypothetical protein
MIKIGLQQLRPEYSYKFMRSVFILDFDGTLVGTQWEVFEK